MTQASDGTMWLADPICDRLVRISRAGAWSAIALRDAATDALAPDASGGVWFAGHNAVGHVDASGQVQRFPLGKREALGVAVTPDGNAWFALGTCRLGHVAPGGTLTYEPVPLPVTSIAGGPGGQLWLASPNRLDLGIQPGTCDDTPPKVTVTPAKKVTLAALRAHGITLKAASRSCSAPPPSTTRVRRPTWARPCARSSAAAYTSTEWRARS